MARRLSYGYQLKSYLAFLAARGKNSLSAGRDDVLAFLEARKDGGRRGGQVPSREGPCDAGTYVRHGDAGFRVGRPHRGLFRPARGLARRAGIEGSVHPHQIRHSTQMLEGGADIRVIQAYLSHRSIMTSQRYTHVSAELLRKACEKAHPGFQRPA